MANTFANVEKVNAIIRVRRGPEVDRTLNIYDSGELIFSTDKKRLFVGDSADNGATGTAGGIVVGNKNWVTNNFEKLSGIVTYDTVYRTDTSNYYLFVGSDYLRPDNYILINPVESNSDAVSYTLPAATSSNLGGVIIKDGLVVSNGYLRVDVDNTTIKIDPATKKLTAVSGTNNNNTTVNTASQNTLGIVKVPLDGGINISNGDISVNVDNSTIKLSSTSDGSKLYVDGSLVKIPVTTNSTLGVVRTGRGLSASSIGTLNLNIASISGLGGVKVGSGLNIDPNDGQLSVDTGVYISNPLNPNHTDVLVYGTSGTWVAASSSTYAGQSLLSANGYQKLPSGLIMQWGVLSAISLDETFHLVNLPLTFPNSIFNVTTTSSYVSSISGSINTVVKELSTTGFYVMGDYSAVSATGDIYWQALGF
jgi:hypothetical protein